MWGSKNDQFYTAIFLTQSYQRKHIQIKRENMRIYTREKRNGLP